MNSYLTVWGGINMDTIYHLEVILVLFSQLTL